MQEALAFHEGFDQRVIEVVFGCPFDDTGIVARRKLGNRSDEDGRSLERFDIHIRSDGGCKLGGTRFGQSVLRALGVESRGGLEAFFFGKT